MTKEEITQTICDWLDQQSADGKFVSEGEPDEEALSLDGWFDFRPLIAALAGETKIDKKSLP